MTFAIESKVKMLVRSVNAVGENHGQQIKPGINLAVEFAIGNDWLDVLSPGLKGSLYGKGGNKTKSKGDEQQSLDGVEIVSDLPNLRYPQLGTLTWDEEYSGRTLILDHGINDSRAIRIPDASVKEIKLTPLEGGSVKVKASVYSCTPDEHERGRLTSLIKSEHMAILQPPEEMQADIVELSKRKTKDATTAFVDEHAPAP